MKIALVGAALEENLSLAYLASPLRIAGHEVTMHSYGSAGMAAEVVSALVAEPPELIGMSVAFQHRLVDFAALAKALRAEGLEAPIVWGGHLPTARAGQILDAYPEVDIIVRHDGEDALRELADALASAPMAAPGASSPRHPDGDLLRRLVAIDGLAFRLPEGRAGATPPRPAVRDLDGLPTPVRDGAQSRHVGLGFAPILGSRGCWQSCTYCSIQTYHRGRGGPRVRLRAPAAIAEEMAELYHGRDTRIFCFHDENFFLQGHRATRRRLARLREELVTRDVGRIGIVAKVRPDQLTKEIVQDAQDLGVMRVYLGVENGSQPGLDHLGRDTTVAACRDALGLLRAAGLYACFNVLLFEPDTTMADIRDNLAFLADYPDFPWNFCRAEVYPGALLEEQLLSRGRLKGGLEGMSYEIADPAVETLFRLTAIAFGGRNFGPQSTANAASGLGYTAALLEHFFPGRESRGLVRMASQVIRRFHEESLTLLREAYEYVAAGPSSGGALRAYTADLAERIATSDAAYWQAMNQLSNDMERLGQRLAPAFLRPPQPGRTLAKAAAVVAAVGLMGLRCDTNGGETVDPAPPDVSADQMIVDPVPMDVRDTGMDYMIADPPPPDVQDAGPDYMMIDVDPPPPDLVDAGPDYMIADPPPPDVQDAGTDYMMADPPPPDVSPDDTKGDSIDTRPPPTDPLPPDMQGSFSDDRPGGPALALHRGFRVQLERLPASAGTVRVQARVSGAPATALRWTATGGQLRVDGATAELRVDGSAPPMILARAEGDRDRLDVARILPDDRA